MGTLIQIRMLLVAAASSGLVSWLLILIGTTGCRSEKLLDKRCLPTPGRLLFRVLPDNEPKRSQVLQVLQRNVIPWEMEQQLNHEERRIQGLGRRSEYTASSAGELRH